MRTDDELKEAWGPLCHVCKGELTEERHLVRSIVPLETEVRGAKEYTSIYVVCKDCKEKGGLV